MSDDPQSPKQDVAPSPSTGSGQGGLAAFWAELKRRKVMRVAITYAVVAWLIIQIAVSTFEGFGIPVWAFRFVVIMLGLFFPVAIILAWAFELTPEGIKTTKTTRQENVDTEETKAHSKKRNWMTYAVGAILPSLIFGILATVFYFKARSASDELVMITSTLAEVENDKSIAVLPLENLSPDPDNAYIADGIHEDLLTYLGKIHDLFIIGRASTMHYLDTPKLPRDIGRELGVRYLMNGSVRQAGETIRITVKLLEAETGAQRWAETYNRPFSDVFSIQTEIAKAVAGELEAFLSPEELADVEKPLTDNETAYQFYLLSKNYDLSTSEREEALKKAVELDPNFYRAWSDLVNTMLFNYRVRSKRQDKELLEIASHAIEQLKRTAPKPSLYLQKESQWAYTLDNDIHTAITLLEESRRIDPEFVGHDLPWRYLEVGRNVEALPLLEEVYQKDPLRGGTLQRLFHCYLLLGLWEQARSLYLKALEHETTYWSDEYYARGIATSNYISSGDVKAYVGELVESDQTGRLWAALISKDYGGAIRIIGGRPPGTLQLLNLSSSAWKFCLSIQPPELAKALIWFALEKEGQWITEAEKAKTYLEEIVKDPYADPGDRYSLLVTYALLGEIEKMEATIMEVREQIQSPNWAYRRGVLTEIHIAIAYLVLGDDDKAIETLEAASKMDGPIFLNRELELWFIFDRLRGNPRFDALLED